MIKKIIFASALLMLFTTKAQQTHTVIKGDTAYSIAKKYGMSFTEFTNLNPNVKDGQIKIGDVLNVKKTANSASENSSSSKEIGHIIIQPKQTIYGITKQYHISETQLRKLNPDLDSNMKIGSKVALPLDLIQKYSNGQPTENIENTIKNTSQNISENSSNNDEKYLVQAKDNYYKITKKFGISQQELFAMNPGLEQKGLQAGDLLIIKKEHLHSSTQNENQNTQKTIANDDEYVTHAVQNGDTIFSILNKYDITLDELLALNPQLSSGLKAGMNLKIRKIESQYVKKSGDALNVVLMLPFGFDSNDSRYRNISTDFLTGAKLAIERNTKKGQKLNINVIDAGNESTFKKSLTQINKNNTDLIIGPLFKSSVLEVLDFVGEAKIPVVAPFANSEELYDYSNLIIVETDDKIYAQKISEEVVKTYNNQNIFIISGTDKTYAEWIKTELQKQLKNAKISVINSATDIKTEQNMATGQAAPIIAILASKDEKTGDAFTSKMIDLSKNLQGNKAFSMYYQPSFEKNIDAISQAHLVYLMDRKINTDGSFEKEILEEYKTKYCKTPSKYAVIGFDVVNDILSRENKSGEVFKQISKVQTQLATKFEYVQVKKNGAYINTGYRVVRLVP